MAMAARGKPAGMQRLNAPQVLPEVAAARERDLQGQLRIRDVLLGDRNGADRLALDRLFTVACSHGADLHHKLLSRRLFSAFVVELGITTSTPMDTFDKHSTMAMRERRESGEVVAKEVSLTRIGREAVDVIYDTALQHSARTTSIHTVSADKTAAKNAVASGAAATASTSATAASSSSPASSGNANMAKSTRPGGQSPPAGPAPTSEPPHEGMDVGGFFVALVELVKLLVPKTALPPLTNDAAHLVLLHVLFVEGYGRDYVNRECSMALDDFALSPVICGVLQEQSTSDLLLDAFLCARGATVFDSLTDLHRRQAYQSILLGDTYVEYDGLSSLFDFINLKHALTASESVYRLLQRYDVKASKNTVMVDFAGFRVFLVNLAVTLFNSVNSLPTPQAKLVHMLDEYFVPHLPSRRTVPTDYAIERDTTLSQLKPNRAVKGSEVWVWGNNFHIREAMTGSRCPLYVRLGDRVVVGRCTSMTLGSIEVPELLQTDDTAIDAVVSVGDSGTEDTLKVNIKYSTVFAVSISDDRLNWTKSSDTVLTFEETAVTLDLDESFVALLRAVFDSYGRRQDDYENEEGEVVHGRTFVFLQEWSKVCQKFPKLGIFDDGEPTTMIHRHQRFFEAARTHLDSPEPSLPSLDWNEFVGLVMRTAVSTHGTSTQVVGVVKDMLDADTAVSRRAAKKLGHEVPGLTSSPSGLTTRSSRFGGTATSGFGGFGGDGGNQAMPAVCANCGQDPLIKMTDNPFIDLGIDADGETTKPKALAEKVPPKMQFMRALSHFQSQLPGAAEALDLPPVDPDTVTIDQAAKLPLASQFNYLASCFDNVVDETEAEKKADKAKAEATIERVKASGKYLTAQVLSLQQTIEGLNDSLTRVQHSLQEVKDYSEKERALRLQGSITASNTMWVMVAQLYDSVKQGLSSIRDQASPYLTINDDGGDFDVARAVDDARSYRDKIVQQAVILETVMEHKVRKAGHESKKRDDAAARKGRRRMSDRRKKDEKENSVRSGDGDVVDESNSLEQTRRKSDDAELPATELSGDKADAALSDGEAASDKPAKASASSRRDDAKPGSGTDRAPSPGAADQTKSPADGLDSGDDAGLHSGTSTPPPGHLGVSSDDLAEQLAGMREALDHQWQQRLRETERQRDMAVKEGATHLYDLLHYCQEAVPIPDEISRRCFRYLEARGKRLKRSFKFAHGADADAGSSEASSTPPPEASLVPAAGGHSTSPPPVKRRGGGAPSGPSVEIQVEENELPSVIDMHSELLIRGFQAAKKLSLPAVLLRKALFSARDSIGRLMSNAVLFDELSKLLKLELQNVMHPRTRDFVKAPGNVAEMFTRDSTTNTLLCDKHFDVSAEEVQRIISGAPAASGPSGAATEGPKKPAGKGGKADGGKDGKKAGGKPGGKAGGKRTASSSPPPGDRSAAASSAAAAADANPDVSAATVAMQGHLHEEMRKYYEEMTKACQTDPARTGVGDRAQEQADAAAAEQLDSIGGLLQQWQKDSEELSAAESRQAALEEWFLNHPSVGVQAVAVGKSTAFQTDMTGEVRMVFRDEYGAMVNKPDTPPPSASEGQATPPPEAADGLDATQSSTAAAAAAGGSTSTNSTSDAGNASDSDAAAGGPLGSSTRVSSAMTQPRVPAAELVDSTCQTIEAWPTSQAAVRDTMAATAAEAVTAPQAPLPPPPLNDEAVDEVLGAAAADATAPASQPRTPPPAATEPAAPPPTTVEVARGQPADRKAVTSQADRAVHVQPRPKKSRTVGVQAGAPDRLPRSAAAPGATPEQGPEGVRAPSTAATSTATPGVSQAPTGLLAVPPPGTALSDASSVTIGGSFDDREEGFTVQPYDEVDVDDEDATDDDEEEEEEEDGRSDGDLDGTPTPDGRMPFSVSVEAPDSADRPAAPRGGDHAASAAAAGDASASLYQRRGDGQTLTIDPAAVLVRSMPTDAAAEEDGDDDEPLVDDDDDDDDVDLNDDGIDVAEEDEGVGPNGRTMTAPLSPSQIVTLLTGDWQALSGIVPSRENPSGTPYEAASAGSNGYDPSSPTKPLSKMKKSVLLKQAQQAVQFHGQLQQAQVLLMQQQQVISHLQQTGLKLQQENDDTKSELLSIKQRFEATRISASVDRATVQQLGRELARLQDELQDSMMQQGREHAAHDAHDGRHHNVQYEEDEEYGDETSASAADSGALPSSSRQAESAATPGDRRPMEEATAAQRRRFRLDSNASAHSDTLGPSQIAASAGSTKALVAQSGSHLTAESLNEQGRAPQQPEEAIDVFVTALREQSDAPRSTGDGKRDVNEAFPDVRMPSDVQVTDVESRPVITPSSHPLLPGADAITVKDSTSVTAEQSAAVTPRPVVKRDGKSRAKPKPKAAQADFSSALWGGSYGLAKTSTARSAGSAGGEDLLGASMSSAGMPHITSSSSGIADVLLRVNGRLQEIETNEKSRETELQLLRDENTRLRMGVGELAARASHLEVQVQVQERAASQMKNRMSSSGSSRVTEEKLHQASMILAERDVCMTRVRTMFKRFAPAEAELSVADSSTSGLVELAGLIERVLKRAMEVRDGVGSSLAAACREFVVKYFPRMATTEFDRDSDLPVLVLSDTLAGEARKVRVRRSEVVAAKSVFDTVAEKIKTAPVHVLLRVDKLLSSGGDEADGYVDDLAAEVINAGSPMRRRQLVGRVDMREEVFPVAGHVMVARDSDATRIAQEGSFAARAENLNEVFTQTFVPRRAVAVQATEPKTYAPPGFLLKLRPTNEIMCQTEITTAALPADADADALAGLGRRHVPLMATTGVQAVEFSVPKLKDLTVTVAKETQTRGGNDSDTTAVFRSGWPWRAQIARLHSVASENSATAAHVDPAVEWLRACYAALNKSLVDPSGDGSATAIGSDGVASTHAAAASASGSIGACVKLMSKQLSALREALEREPKRGPKTSPSVVLNYARTAMLERGLSVINDLLESPLEVGMETRATHVERGLTVRTDAVKCDDLNLVIQRLLARIDSRLVKRDIAALGSQRAINRYHQRIIEALVDNAVANDASSSVRSAGLSAYSPEELRTMQRLVDFETPLTASQQRHLSEMQITALSTVMHTHAWSASFVTLAIAAGCSDVDKDGAAKLAVQGVKTEAAEALRVMQLSLTAPSAAAAKVARIAVCRKLLPAQVFNALASEVNRPLGSAADGDRDHSILRDVNKLPVSVRRFIADILSYPLEGLAFLLRSGEPAKFVNGEPFDDSSVENPKSSGEVAAHQRSRRARGGGKYQHAAHSLVTAWQAVSTEDRLGLFHTRGSWLLSMKPCSDVPFTRWVLLCGEALRRILRINTAADIAEFEPVDLGRRRDEELASHAARVLAHTKLAIESAAKRHTTMPPKDGDRSPSPATKGTSATYSPSKRKPDVVMSPDVHHGSATASPEGSPHAAARAGDAAESSRVAASPQPSGSQSFSVIMEKRKLQRERLAREAASIATEAELRKAASGSQDPLAVAPGMNAFGPGQPPGNAFASPLATPARQPSHGAAMVSPTVRPRAASDSPTHALSASGRGPPGRPGVLSPMVTPPPRTLPQEPLSLSAGRQQQPPGHRAPPARLPRMQEYFNNALAADSPYNRAAQPQQQRAAPTDAKNAAVHGTRIV